MSGPIEREPARARTGWADWVGVAVVLASAVYFITTLWRTTPDPVVDFGRDMYLPWRVGAGEALYRDVQHFNGPLSVHVNAIAFKAFGVGRARCWGSTRH